MAFSNVTVPKYIKYYFTVQYFCRASVEAIMLFVWDSCACEYMRMCCLLSAHSVCILQIQRNRAHLSHIRKQLLPFIDVEFNFFLSKYRWLHFCNTKLKTSSFNLWLSQTSFASFWSQWAICCGLQDENTVISRSAFSVMDGGGLNGSFNSWARQAQTQWSLFSLF